MRSGQGSWWPWRWSDSWVGGAAAGIGVHLLLRGMHRVLGPRGLVVGVACASGALGALVASRLARWRPRPPALALVSASPPRAEPRAPLEEDGPRPPVGRALRRGPSGREHPWLEAWRPTPA